VAQVRPGEDGLVLQQLLYADEVRSMKELDIEKAAAKPAELKLALQLIEQISVDEYDAAAFKDEEKERIKDAIDEKIAGKEIVAAESPERGEAGSAQVIDIVEALKASLAKSPAKAPPATRAPAAEEGKERKAPKRAAAKKAAAAPVRARAGK
jgi:DNA end-binding protein Ku